VSIGPIELLILIALGVAIGTSFRRVARAREERGPDAIQASSGHLMALLGVRVGSVLLVVSVFVLLVGTGEGEAAESAYAIYALVSVAAVLMVAFGGVRLHQDRQAALASGPSPGEPTKRCPHCAEAIQAAASVCRYCGRDVEPSERKR
jgi:hypothetical protein